MAPAEAPQLHRVPPRVRTGRRLDDEAGTAVRLLRDLPAADFKLVDSLRGHYALVDIGDLPTQAADQPQRLAQRHFEDEGANADVCQLRTHREQQQAKKDQPRADFCVGVCGPIGFPIQKGRWAGVCIPQGCFALRPRSPIQTLSATHATHGDSG